MAAQDGVAPRFRHNFSLLLVTNCGYSPDMRQAPQPKRQEFHHAHTSIGAAGHWLKTAGILAPLIIGEFVKDADKRWRYIRLASVATALVSEGMYAAHVQREREERLAERDECWQERVGREREGRRETERTT
jgi:hypothetical protein